MHSSPTISETTAPWRDVVMLCRRCSRKLDGGFGKKGKHDLAGVLKQALKDTGRRRELRIVEVGCLSLCPKRAVTAVSSAQPSRVLAIPAGAEIADVLACLSPAAASTPASGHPG